MLAGRVMEGLLQPRMDRTLAAVHDDRRVVLAPGRVEPHLVVGRERVPSQPALADQRGHVVPVEPGTADGDRRAAHARRGLGGGGGEPAEVIMQAVVVIEEAVADPEDRLRGRARILPARPELSPRRGREQGCEDEGAQGKRREGTGGHGREGRRGTRRRGRAAKPGRAAAVKPPAPGDSGSGLHQRGGRAVLFA